MPHAHAGILAAAKARWEDLEDHGILGVLLGSSEPFEGTDTADGCAGVAAEGNGSGSCGGGSGGGYAGDEASMELGTSSSIPAEAQPGGVPLSEVCTYSP